MMKLRRTGRWRGDLDKGPVLQAALAERGGKKTRKPLTSDGQKKKRAIVANLYSRHLRRLPMR